MRLMRRDLGVIFQAAMSQTEIDKWMALARNTLNIGAVLISRSSLAVFL